MKMSEEMIAYPVLCIAKGIAEQPYLYFARSEAELTTCSQVGLKSGFYDMLVVFDVLGREYVVGDVKIVNKSDWGSRIRTLLGRQLTVDLSLIRIGKADFETFKNRVLNVMQNNELYDCDYEMLHMVRTYNDFAEMIVGLTEFFYIK